MNSFQLSLIREDNPRDFLATLGLLRLLDERWPQLRPQLSWINHLPKFTFNDDLPKDWSATLVEDLKSLNELEPCPFRHGNVIKTKRDNYQKALGYAQKFAAESNHPFKNLPAKLYAAYSSQLTEEKTDEIAVSAFSFSNGQAGKKLLLDVSQLIEQLPTDALADFITGNPKLESAKSFRWHPDEYRASAYRSHDPGAGIRGDSHLDHPVLNILAFFGLSFFPTIPSGPRGATAGMTRENGQTLFRWPIWSPSLNSQSLGLILHQNHLHSANNQICRRLGIERAWCSVRFSADKSLYFSPAKMSF